MKYLLLLLPLFAHAGEAELACDLERSKTEISASLLQAPQAFGSLGQDASTGTKSIQIGISQSFSGRTRAALLRESTEAKCDAIRATLQLDEYGRWAEAKVTHEGAVAELRIIDEGIEFAKTNIVLLDAQLAAQTITINQHNEARSAYVALEARKAALLRVLSTSVLPIPPVNAVQLIATASAAESSSAALAAKSAANAAWDVVIQGGARQAIGGKATAFATIGFKYSFGYDEAMQAAENVGTQTAALLAVQQGGYAQVLSRQSKELTALIEAESLAIRSGTRQVLALQDIRESIKGIDTALALNTLRSVDLQLFSLVATVVGAEARVSGYKKLLAK